MPLKTKIDTHSFRGILHSKVLGLPLPVVAVGAGVGAVILIRRHSAAAGSSSSDAGSSDAGSASSGGSYGGDTGGASGSGGGSTFFPPVPVPIPGGPPGRRPRIKRRGVIDKTVIYRKDRQGNAVRIVRRVWAGGTTVIRRRVIGTDAHGSPPRIHRVPPRASSERVTLPRKVSTAQARSHRRPRPASVPATHFA